LGRISDSKHRFQAETKVYDPKFHYSAHSPEKLADLMAEFKLIQSGYERNLGEHAKRAHRLALVYDEVSFFFFFLTDRRMQVMRSGKAC
jgi:hypothetical protein